MHPMRYLEKISLTAGILAASIGYNVVASDLAQKAKSVFSRRGGGGAAKSKKALTLSTISPNILKMEYAVRGKVVIEADRISTELKDKSKPNSHPFDHIVYTNIGNPHSVGQKPLTWPRQVSALCDLPAEVGIDHPAAASLFPSDVIERAREIKAKLGVSGTGAYSDSRGQLCFREEVVAFMEERDGGVKADVNNIYMTNGASTAINMLLNVIVSNEKVGIMIPIPQYPVYSATIDILGGKKVGYYLDESKGWEANMEEIKRSYAEAKAQGIDVKAFVLINPGNPTGQILSERALKDVLMFCSENGLVVFADEVYQVNVYEPNEPATKFESCKKLANDLGLIENDAIELASFHSTSKGLFGECGRRGGYMEVVGFDPDVQAQLYKLASSGLCSSINGQLMTALMCRGPAPGDASYDSHEKEKEVLYQDLVRKSELACSMLNSVDGIECTKAQGAMYLFPSITIPDKAIEAAKAQNISPDTLYALSLLKYAGICVVPASGFSQKEGRFGFRTTFLPNMEEMERAMKLMGEHHKYFCETYK